MAMRPLAALGLLAAASGINNADPELMMALDCKGQFHVFPEAILGLSMDVRYVMDVMDGLIEQTKQRVACACPDTPRALIDDRYSFVRQALEHGTGEAFPTDACLDDPDMPVRSWKSFTDLLMHQPNFPKLPEETCNIGKTGQCGFRLPAKLRFAEGKTGDILAWVGTCPDTGDYSFSLHCTGELCKSMAVPPKPEQLCNVQAASGEEGSCLTGERCESLLDEKVSGPLEIFLRPALKKIAGRDVDLAVCQTPRGEDDEGASYGDYLPWDGRLVTADGEQTADANLLASRYGSLTRLPPRALGLDFGISCLGEMLFGNTFGLEFRHLQAWLDGISEATEAMFGTLAKAGFAPVTAPAMPWNPRFLMEMFVDAAAENAMSLPQLRHIMTSIMPPDEDVDVDPAFVMAYADVDKSGSLEGKEMLIAMMVPPLKIMELLSPGEPGEPPANPAAIGGVFQLMVQRTFLEPVSTFGYKVWQLSKHAAMSWAGAGFRTFLGDDFAVSVWVDECADAPGGVAETLMRVDGSVVDMFLGKAPMCSSDDQCGAGMHCASVKEYMKESVMAMFSESNDTIPIDDLIAVAEAEAEAGAMSFEHDYIGSFLFAPFNKTTLPQMLEMPQGMYDSEAWSKRATLAKYLFDPVPSKFETCSSTELFVDDLAHAHLLGVLAEEHLDELRTAGPYGLKTCRKRIHSDTEPKITIGEEGHITINSMTSNFVPNPLRDLLMMGPHDAETTSSHDTEAALTTGSQDATKMSSTDVIFAVMGLAVLAMAVALIVALMRRSGKDGAAPVDSPTSPQTPDTVKACDVEAAERAVQLELRKMVEQTELEAGNMAAEEVEHV
eukprot:TRINITY_DN3934_c0_g2_i1.p1 TRINITY_DN3934_c0_g2~~TRINITY_DN3934_c0_g2_i1.p1  ORF type:complete len:837 (+),score=203.01 TRINITY_DN3934_c0_g2_i1:61-2571(+)